MSGLRPKVTPALELLQRITATRRPHRAGRSYDPFGAQVGEVTGRTYVALQEKLNSVERAWEQATCRTAPQELAAIRESCQARVDWTKRLTQMAREKRDLIPSLVASVDMLAGVLSQCFSVCDDLEEKLSGYLDPSTRSTLAVSYSSTARRMMLDATGRFANEVVWRAGLNHAIKLVPAFGDSFMLMPLWSALGLSGASQPRPVPGTAMVILPFGLVNYDSGLSSRDCSRSHAPTGRAKGPGLIEEFLAKAGDFAGINDLMQDLATSAARIGESSAEHITGAYRVRACERNCFVIFSRAWFVGQHISIQWLDLLRVRYRTSFVHLG